MSDEATTTEEVSAPETQPEESVKDDDGKYKSIARKQEQKYIEAAKERDELAAKLAEIEKAQLSEVERAKQEAEEARTKLEALTAEAEAAKLAALRTRIGAEKGLPPQLIERLQGDDAESIAADADSLLAAVKKDDKAWPDMGQGDKGKPSEADRFEESVFKNLGIPVT
jgi:phage/plasmid primase-like uncharacterized protein